MMFGLFVLVMISGFLNVVKVVFGRVEVVLLLLIFRYLKVNFGICLVFMLSDLKLSW